jgi:hypothetical protein
MALLYSDGSYVVAGRCLTKDRVQEIASRQRPMWQVGSKEDRKEAVRKDTEVALARAILG